MKRSKVLSILLAVMMLVGTFSCLTVVSSAANLVAHGYTPDTANAEDPDERVVAWEFYDDGVLYLYDYPGTVSWSKFADVLTKVELKAGPGKDECMLTEIPAYAFYGCENLTAVDLSKGVNLQIIGAYAFNGCTALTDIALDQGIITLHDYAFYGCTALKKVTFSYNLTNVGQNVFKGCTALETVVVPNGVLTIGYGMFEDCSALTTIALPDSVNEIGELAFADCTGLEEIIVSDSVAKVGRYAFYNCSSAKTAYVGHNAEEIGEYAFGGCTALEEVEIACALTTFSEGMFKDCTSLTSIKLVDGVKTIGKSAFMGCVNLADIQLPSTLVTIADSAFDSTAITTITIPADVSTIEYGAFTNCTALTEIKVDNKNDKFFSVDGVLYDIALSVLVACPAGKTGEVTVTDGTTAIAEDAFIGCTGITKVIIPDSVIEIAPNAFNNCSDSLVIKGNCNSYAIGYAKGRGIATEITHVESSAWQTTLAPTCLEKGAEQLVCTGCGEVFETKELDALGHNYDKGVVTTDATCETDGVMTYTCTRTDCTSTYTKPIPATKHNFDSGKVISAATCETAGTMRYTCQNAGCLESYDEEIKALGHNMDDGKVVTPATCETDGEKVFKCQNTGCLLETTETIPATGHKYDGGVVTTKETCEDNGVLTFTCTNEGCTASYTEDIPALGHNYIATEIKVASCISNGKVQHTCSNCGDSYVENTVGTHPQTASVTVASTCTQSGKSGQWCALCSQFVGEVTEIPATGHKYENGACTACGDTTGAQQPTTPGGTVVTPEEGGESGNNQPTTAKPATPKLLLLMNRNEGLVLTWKAVEGATAYRVYRRGAGEKSWTYLTTVTDTTFVDSEAETGKYWRYTVRATNEAGYSGFENGLYIKRVDTPHLTGISNVADGVKISWTSISNAKSYKIYRRGAGETWKCIATVGASATSYTDTAIKNNSGNYYRYTVRAIDGYYSAYEEGLLTRYVATPHLTGIANTSNGVKVNWSSVNGADAYRVYRRGAGQSWVYVTTVTGTSYVDTSVKNANGYYRYTVRAVDGGRYSGYETGLLIKK